MRATRTIQRLARYAETRFANLCASSGALCHESQEDENGWDYLVEFPEDVASGPADTQPPGKQAFVQVKSTRNGRLSCSLKLSNALKAAKSRAPWFIILMVDANPVPKTYAVHVWTNEIEQWLRAGRKASIENALLNRRRINLSFTENDLHSADLIDWMKKTIGAVGQEYGDSKKVIYETIGYADGHGSGKITFASENAEKIFDEILGLGTGLAINKFTYTPSRFGLSDSRPMVDVAAGTVQITPQAVSDCELRIRGPNSNTLLSVPGKIFTLGMPWIPAAQQRFRVAATGFEVIWMNEGESKFTASLLADARVPLSEISRFVTVITWLGLGPVDVQVWVGNRRLVGGVLNSDDDRQNPNWSRMRDIVETLRSLQPLSGSVELCASLADIQSGSKDLYLMHEVIGNYDMCMEFQPIPGPAYDFTKVLYYSTVDAGDLTAYALVERDVLSWADVEGGRKKVDFGRPTIRESWLVTNADEGQRLLMIEDFEYHLAQLEKNNKILNIGDIQVFVQNLKTKDLIELPTRP
jgi:hypothetical protein